MSSFACPDCGNPLSPGGLCRDCGYRLKPVKKVEPLSTAHKPAALPRQWTKAEWRENQRLCEPLLQKCKAVLAAAQAKHKNDAMPHILSGVVLRGIDYDAEAIAEREAIQND